MKASGFAILVVPAVSIAHGDLLTDSRGLLGSPAPEYDPEAFEPDSAVSEPNYAPFSPADSDLGVQQILGRYTGPPPVFFDVSLDFNYTDNAPARARRFEDPSWYWSGRVAASWQPHLFAGWFADIGVSQEIFRFEDSRAIDFENSEAHVGVVKNLPDLDDLLFYARYEYQRLADGSLSESNYSAQRIRTGLQKTIFATPRQQLAGRVSAAFDLDANPERLERNEYEAELSYTWWFTDTLSTTASAGTGWWDFDNGGREDWHHTAGLELTWQIARGAIVYANVFFTDHDSNTPLGLNDAKVWQTGVGTGFTFNF